jgi:hypothetical protein
MSFRVFLVCVETGDTFEEIIVVSDSSGNVIQDSYSNRRYIDRSMSGASRLLKQDTY